jgi:hypothetical protein
MQRLGSGGGYTRKTKRGGGNDPSCGCDMQAGWPKFLTENIPLPTGQTGGGSCGIPPIPNYYQGGGGCGCTGGLLPPQSGGGNLAGYNSNPVPDACPFPGTGYCGFYARGGANYGEPMNLQAKLRGGKQSGAGCGCMTRRGGAYRPTKKNLKALKKWRKGQSIGFTMTSSLKAKGLIPRTSKKHRGKKVKSAKYR